MGDPCTTETWIHIPLPSLYTLEMLLKFYGSVAYHLPTTASAEKIINKMQNKFLTALSFI